MVKILRSSVGGGSAVRTHSLEVQNSDRFVISAWIFVNAKLREEPRIREFPVNRDWIFICAKRQFKTDIFIYEVLKNIIITLLLLFCELPVQPMNERQMRGCG